MDKTDDPFRDYGIHPDDVPAPPAGPVTCRFGTATVFGQYLASTIAVTLGAGLGALVGSQLPLPLNLLVITGGVGLGVWLVVYAARHDYRWVEVNATGLRGRHLYTGREISRPLTDVREVVTVLLPARTPTASSHLAARITNKLLGRVRGVQIRFKTGKAEIRIQRADPAMINAADFLRAMYGHMKNTGNLKTTVEELDGRPLVRRVEWGETSPAMTPPFSTPQKLTWS